MEPENLPPPSPIISSSTSTNTTDSVNLKRRLTLRNGVGIIIGIIIGSGIYISPKGVLQDTGSVGMALCVWVLCGGITLVGGLCYAELGTSIPVSGGSYSYVLEAFGELPAVMILWISVVVRTPAGNAIMAKAFATYALDPLFNACEVPIVAENFLAALAIILLSWINCVSVKWSVRLCDFLLFMKVSSLIIIIIAGFVKLIGGYSVNFENSFEGTNVNPGNVALAFYSGLLSYSGWDGFNYVTEEIKNPKRNLPLAIILSVPMVTVIYLLVNISFFIVLDKEAFLNSEAVAVDFGLKALGVAHVIVPVFVALSCFGSLNAAILTGSRTFFVGARDGNLPCVLAMVNMKFMTPITSVVFTGIVTIVMLLYTDLYGLIAYFAFCETIQLGAPVVGLLYLRWKKPHMARPLKINIAIPIIYLITCIFLLVFPWFVEPFNNFIGLLVFLSGIPVYLIGVRWKNKPKWMLKMIKSFTTKTQFFFYCCQQDKYEEKLM